MEEGHPLPLGTLTSPPLRQRRRKTPLGRARPPLGRGALRAKQRQPGVLHSRLRSMSRRRQLVLRHGSRTQWRPVASRLPCQSGSGPPLHRATTRATSRPCQRLRLPSPLFPWVAWRRQPWRLTQSHPRPMVAVRRHLPTRPALSAPRPGTNPMAQPTGSGHHTSNRSAILPSGRSGPQASSAAAAQDPVQDATPPRVLSPTSPAEPAKEGGGATTPSVEGGIPPATAPAVPVPEGEPRLLRLDVSCQVGTHLVVLRMATTANSTISSLIAKAKERASAPGLTVASLHGSPDVGCGAAAR